MPVFAPSASVRAVTRRRACLVVPAAPAAKLEKGRTIAADEVVVDLEDAVVPASKDEARGAVVDALGGAWAAESVAVRARCGRARGAHGRAAEGRAPA
jgi:citrate lyase beta subunit